MSCKRTEGRSGPLLEGLHHPPSWRTAYMEPERGQPWAGHRRTPILRHWGVLPPLRSGGFDNTSGVPSRTSRAAIRFWNISFRRRLSVGYIISNLPWNRYTKSGVNVYIIYIDRVEDLRLAWHETLVCCPFEVADNGFERPTSASVFGGGVNEPPGLQRR